MHQRTNQKPEGLKENPNVGKARIKVEHDPPKSKKKLTS